MLKSIRLIFNYIGIVILVISNYIFRGDEFDRHFDEFVIK